LTNKTAQGYGSNAANLYGPLTSQAQSLVNSQGYAPADLAAITNAGMGGVNAAFGTASDQVARTAARSGNPASVGAEQDALARSKGIAGGQEAGNIQIANAQEKDTQRQQGLNLLNSLYGTQVGAQTNLLGLGPGTLNARAAGQSGAQDFASIMKGISSVAAVPGGGG